jgi:hypothetical protein
LVVYRREVFTRRVITSGTAERTVPRNPGHNAATVVEWECIFACGIVLMMLFYVPFLEIIRSWA